MLYFIYGGNMKTLKLITITFLVLCLIPIGINFYVIYESSSNIIDIKKIDKKYDIGLVLGCSVLRDGSPSKMLRDRLEKSIELYKEEKIDKILISGDHQKTYSEITTMNQYLINNNIPEEDILIDEKGYSTGESLINYKNNYKDKSVIIITQEYHLYRALFIAENMEISAIGTQAKKINYNGQIFREIREILARNKDFVLYHVFN